MTRANNGADNQPPQGSGAPSVSAPSLDQDKKSPAEWGKTVGPKQAHIFAAAAQLFGWIEHEHHFQNVPLLLTEAEFSAALKAAGEYPGGKDPLPVAAFGKLAGERFKAKQEAKAKAEAKAKKGDK